MSSAAAERAHTMVRLAKPVMFAGNSHAEVRINEPGGSLYAELGEPRVMVYNATGSGYFVEQIGVVKAYLDKLIVAEHGGDIMFALLCLEDAKAVKEALFDFFTAAEARLIARKATSSSSASA